MIDSPSSRREALQRAAIVGGAVAAGSLMGPAAALAQATPEEEDQRDFLVEAIGIEQITVLAYASAADAADEALTKTLEAFRDQEQAHANALQTALESIGFEAPDEPSDAADIAVYEEAPFADEPDLDGVAERLTGLLEGLEGLERPEELLDYVNELEREQLSLYIGRGAALDSEDLATTAAEIAGCQAQHLVVLAQETGDELPQALQAASEAVRAAGLEEAEPAEPESDAGGDSGSE